MKTLVQLFLFIVLVSTISTFSQSWTPVNNPSGGRVLDIFVHTSGDILAGTANGPYSSTDGGSTWNSRKGSNQPFAASKVRMNSIGHLFWQTGFYLYYSTDNGTTWTDINNGTWSNGGDIQLNSNDDIFVATTSDNIWRSIDNGSSWTQLINVPGAEAIGINSQQVIFAARGGKIYRSADNGDNWQIVYTDSSSSNTIRQFAFDGQNTIYGVIWSKGVLKSTDGGNTWNYMNNGLPIVYTNKITISNNGDVFVGKAFSGGIGGGIYRSTDGGNNWFEYSTGLTDKDIYALDVLSSGEVLAGTGAGGVYRREAGGNSWISSSAGLQGVSINLISANSNGDIYAATNAGIYRSTDGAGSWSWSIEGLEDTDMEAFGIHPSGDLYTADGYKIYRSTDDGSTWINVTNNIAGGEVDVLQIAINSVGDIFLATDDHGVLYSSDNGQNWSARNNGLPYLDLRSIITNSNDIVFMSDGVTTFRSSDYGQNWEEIMNGLPDGDISEFAVGQNDVLLGATYSDGIYRSTDNGDNWTLTLDIDVESFAVNGSEIYAGSNLIANGGVYRSTDNGLTWAQMNENLPSLQVEALAYKPGDRLFAEVRNNGLYANNLTVDVDNINSRLPENHSLFQNYPNPFNPTTTINFSIPEASFVSLKIFNSLGQEIETLVVKELNAGNYTYGWNAENLASGIYFYKLQAADFVETKKMMLLK